MSAPYGVTIAPLPSELRLNFATTFAKAWIDDGGSRIDGLIAGYLMLDNSGAVSALELVDALQVSRGSVSTHTRQLMARGIIRRIRKPGDRTHYFTIAEDLWLSLLQAKQEYFSCQLTLAEQVLSEVPEGTPAHRHLVEMARYMDWIHGLGLPGTWARHPAD
ncbi:MAG: MarR family transcriptional regulator [Bowdeniella nasicola]|nr:MarR family transcriptional regulator [Bowdeniella nasicola]